MAGLMDELTLFDVLAFAVGTALEVAEEVLVVFRHQGASAVGVGADPGVVEVVLPLLTLFGCLRVFHHSEAIYVAENSDSGENIA